MLVPGHSPAPTDFDLLSEFDSPEESGNAINDSPETPLAAADPVETDAPEIEVQAELDDPGTESLTAVNWSAWKRNRDSDKDPTGIAEVPPPEHEPLSAFPPSDLPDDEFLVESPLDGIDDLLLSSETDLPVTSEAANIAAEDPFAAPDDAPLQIDGITPSDSEFPIYCKICGTLVYGRLSQVGSSIKCPDCYSPIPVVKPANEEKIRPVTPKSTATTEAMDDLEYRLAPPPELPPIDTTIDRSLGELDFDDDAFFEKRRALQEAQDSDGDLDDDLLGASTDLGMASNDNAAMADPLSPESDPVPGDDAGDLEYTLVDESPVEPKSEVDSIDDLLSQYHASEATPQSVEIEGRSPDMPVRVAPVDDDGDSTSVDKASTGSRGEATGETEDSVEKKPARKSSRRRHRSRQAEGHTDIPSPVAGLGSWAAKALAVAFRRNNVTRMGMAAAVLTIAALLIGSGLALLDPKNNYFYNFGGWAVFLMGCVPLLGFLLFLGVFGNHAIRRAMDDDYEEDELPDFSFAEWGGQFVFMSIGVGLAALPGLLLGHVMWVITEQFWFLPGLAIVSAVLGSPLFLASVVFDDSPFALFSARTFRSIRGLRFRWLRYWTCGLLLAIAIAFAAWGSVQGVFLAVICSVVIVLALNGICWMLGDLLGYVVRWKEHEIEQRA